MIRTMGVCLALCGSLSVVLPASADDEREGLIYHSIFNLSRFKRDSGVRPVSDTLPKPVAPTEEAPPPADMGGVYAPGCETGCCPRPGCSSCYNGPGRPLPEPSCYVNNQYEPEWYVAPMIGFQNPFQANWQLQGHPLVIDPDGGPQGGVAFGWATGPTWLGRRRVEIEFMARVNDVDDFQFNKVFLHSNGGDITTYSGMVNVFWDFKQPDRDWYPYIGVGAGGADITYSSNVGAFGNKDLNDTVFAYQVMGGVSWRLRSYLEFFAEARYFGTSNPEFIASSPAGATLGGTALAAGEHTMQGHFSTWGTMFGVRFILGKRRCAADCPACDGRSTCGNSGWKFHSFW